MNQNSTYSAISALVAADLVYDPISYLDTLEIVVFPRTTAGFRDALQKLNQGRTKRRGRRGRRRQFRRRGEVWVLRQPTRALLSFLTQAKLNNSWSFEVARVDIAVDFQTETPVDAQKVKSFLQHHMRQKWHGKAPATTYQNTTYGGPAAKRRNYAIYADKASKVTGCPCAHLELRFRSFQRCRKKRFDDLNNLASGINAMKLLEEETCLEIIVPDRFDRFLEQVARATKRANRGMAHWLLDDVREKVARVIARILHNDVETVSPGSVEGVHVQDAHDRLKTLRRSFVRLEWHEFTDPPRWVHWQNEVVNTHNPTHSP